VPDHPLISRRRLPAASSPDRTTLGRLSIFSILARVRDAHADPDDHNRILRRLPATNAFPPPGSQRSRTLRFAGPGVIEQISLEPPF
jgi:hypothetical protein